MSVFADAHFFFALVNSSDSAHRLAVNFSRHNTDRLVTTIWVLTEVADGLTSKRCSTFQKILDLLDLDAENEVVEPSLELFTSGLKLFQARPDKAWSLTDCISFEVMESRGIKLALTADRHFVQAGFTALLAED